MVADFYRIGITQIKRRKKPYGTELTLPPCGSNSDACKDYIHHAKCCPSNTIVIKNSKHS